MIRVPSILSLAAVLISCASPRLVHEDVAGCYAMQWRTDDDTAHLSLNPDSLMLSLERYSPPTDIARRTGVIEFRKAHLARQQRMSLNNGYGEVAWEDRDSWWWWRLEGDTVVFATGHNAVDLMGFRAAVHGGRLSGMGMWDNDYGPGAEFSVTGDRIPCPEQTWGK